MGDSTWETTTGRTISPIQAWVMLREQAPPTEVFEGRCQYCRYMLVAVEWRYRRLPYRLWVWRRALMRGVGYWRAWTLRKCPQCVFDDEVRG